MQTNLGAHEEHTLEEVQAFVTQASDSVPDLHNESEDTIATAEHVVVRYTMTGTQQGEFNGIPLTGEAVEIAGVAIYRIDDGTIAEA